MIRSRKFGYLCHQIYRGHVLGLMRVSEHVHALRIPFQINIGPGQKLDRFVYCYVVEGDGITLIDTGVAGSEKIISDHLDEQGSDLDEIKRIILTHTHPDHMGAAKAIQTATGCIVAVHKAERAWAEDVELQNRQRPVPGFHDLLSGSVQVEQELTDGEKIVLGPSLRMEVFHTPGHSPGSCSFLLEGILFSGDAIPLPGEMPIYDDFTISLASLERLQYTPGARRLCMSWASPTKGVEKSIADGISYLEKVDATVGRVRATIPGIDDEELCRGVLDELGMKTMPVMPLMIRSLLSHKAHSK